MRRGGLSLRCIGDPVTGWGRIRLLRGPDASAVKVVGVRAAQPARTPKNDVKSIIIRPPKGSYTSLPCVTGSPIHLNFRHILAVLMVLARSGQTSDFHVGLRKLHTRLECGERGRGRGYLQECNFGLPSLDDFSIQRVPPRCSRLISSASGL